MTLHPYNMSQGTPEWDEARRGIVTASTVHALITAKTLKPASNIEFRSLAATLVAERINGWTDDRYVSFDMARGHEIEPIVRDLYSEHYAPVTELGFMVEDKWGYRIGFSPDGLVGEDGLIETKSRRPKEHLLTVIADQVPAENMAQLQCALLVSGRSWIDYLSFSGGMRLWRKRVLPDPRWQEAIVNAVAVFEKTAALTIERYLALTDGLPETERTITDVEEMRI